MAKVRNNSENCKFLEKYLWITFLVRIKVLKCLASTNNCITFAAYGCNDIERNTEWNNQGAVIRYLDACFVGRYFTGVFW